MDTAISIHTFAQVIPASLLPESGKVFYSGRNAFASPAPLYVLGVNPGGDPLTHVGETVASRTRQVINELPADWSAYRDESWKEAAPGTHGMAPRVLHLFRRLGLPPGSVPASNLYFVRSRREHHIKERHKALAEMCWPFHALVLQKLKPRAVLCLGSTAGAYVCKQMGANQCVDEFAERNNRRWVSRTFVNPQGLKVVVATHPSIADWTVNASDPSGLVEKALR